MNKFKLIILAGTISAASVNAGQIQIGGTNGLTADYIAHPNTITSNNTQGCANANSGGCINNNTNQWTEKNYITGLFSGATGITNATSNGVATALPNQGATTAASSLTDPNNAGGVTFNLLNDTSVSAGGMNIWASTAAGQDTLTIPVGVFGVSRVWLALNDVWGWAGDSAPTVTFNFGNASDVATSADVATLGNGTNGALRSSVHCTNVNCNPTTIGGSSIVSGNPLASQVVIPNVIGDAQVTYSTLWQANYASAASRYGATSGTLTLDDLGFNFGSSYSDQYLVSISLRSSTTNSNQNSRLALSGVTVDTSVVDPVPEPSSIVLIAGGLGMLGLARFRRK